MADLSNLVPSDKSDREAAQRAIAYGWPGDEPVIGELLTWLQDCNWPVAHILIPFLAQIGDPLAPHLRPIFDGDDDGWKYWIIVEILGRGPMTLAEQFRADLERLVQHPTPMEVEAELPEMAKGVLDRLDRAE